MSASLFALSKTHPFLRPASVSPFMPFSFLRIFSHFLLLDLPGAGVKGRNPESYFEDFALVMLDALVFVVKEERLTLPDMFLHVLGKALPRGMPVFLLYTNRDLVMSNIKKEFKSHEGRKPTKKEMKQVCCSLISVSFLLPVCLHRYLCNAAMQYLQLSHAPSLSFLSLEKCAAHCQHQGIMPRAASNSEEGRASGRCLSASD